MGPRVRTLAGVAVMLLLILGSSVAVNAADERLALKGYDPVSYFTEGRAMRGDARFRFEWDGAVYHFASAEHLELFKSDPDRYVPQYNNWCTASLANGVKVAGDPEYWAIIDGRLYLFGGPAGPATMRADPQTMKQRADGNFAKMAKVPEAK